MSVRVGDPGVSFSFYAMRPLGKCAECNKPIRPAQLIHWTDDRRTVHDGCLR